jgi:hypothetical protein
MNDDETVTVWEIFQRGPLPIRCHECNAPLFPTKHLVGEGHPATAACDGQNFAKHRHVNVYRNDFGTKA